MSTSSASLTVLKHLLGTFPKGEGINGGVPKSLPPWGRWPSRQLVAVSEVG